MNKLYIHFIIQSLQQLALLCHTTYSLQMDLQKENINLANILSLRRQQNQLLEKHIQANPNFQKRVKPKIDLIQVRRGGLVSKLLKKTQLSEKIKEEYSDKIAQTYYEQILLSLTKEDRILNDCLKMHSIKPHLRSKMVDWMVQVLCTYEMSQEAFFRSVWVMDAYFAKEHICQQLRQLHIIGVASMFIACKYEDVYPIKLDTFSQKICKGKFSSQQILFKESRILQVLNFSIQAPTLLQVLNHVLSSYFLILVALTSKMQKPLSTSLRKVVLYLAKMSQIDQELAQYSNLKLSISIIFVALKTLEQTQTELSSDLQLKQLCLLMQTDEAQILEISKILLELAKNYSLFYPQLKNIQKFHKLLINSDGQR